MLIGFIDFAGNKRAHNKQVEKQEESWRTPNIKQHSASLHVV